MEWKAKWIWDDGDPAPVNAYRYFTKRFMLPEDCPQERMAARISADSRYVFFINGSRFHGPAPSTHQTKSYDVIDLSGMIRPGKQSTIEFIVNYIGATTFDHIQNRAGFLFEMGDIISDETWLVSTRTPWLSDSPKLTVQQGHCEHFDARLLPNRFTAHIDTEAWKPATVIAQAEGGPWPRLEERDIPLPRLEAVIDDISLLEYGNCSPGMGDSFAMQMTQETLYPLRNGSVKRELNEEPTIVIDRHDEDIYLLYDFGREVSGFLVLEVSADSSVEGGIVDIGYDEALRVGETASGLQHAWANSGDLQYADRLILRNGLSRFENYGHRAFRYLRLAFRGFKGLAHVERVYLLESTYPVNRAGSFTCSDARLNSIWEIGRRTLQLCMDDKFMDCPWRERAQWIGDAKVEAYGAQYCFGDTLLLRRMLRQIAETQYPDGHIDPVGPGDWDAHAPNQPIPGFIAIWIQCVADYYLLTADTTLLAESMPAVERAIGWFQSFDNSEGLLENVVGWNFIDWAPGMSGGNTGSYAALSLQYLQALRATATVAGAIGDTEKQAKYAAQASRFAELCDTAFWDEQRGLYKDFVLPTPNADGNPGLAAAPDSESPAEVTPPVTYSQQVNTLALLYELGSEERRERVLQALLTDESLTQIGSPYFSYYLLAALYKYGQHDQALAYIRKHWGMMLDAGATSWWEEYHGKTSRCHAWSCGPTIDLQAQVLGVTPGAPGFDVVQIAPHPVDLNWAKGIVPIPQGEVVVSWRKTDDRGGFVLDITSPPAVQLRPILPATPAGGTVTVNDEPITGDLRVLPGGGYRIEVTVPSAQQQSPD